MQGSGTLSEIARALGDAGAWLWAHPYVMLPVVVMVLVLLVGRARGPH
jgi:hypothetical protein